MSSLPHRTDARGFDLSRWENPDHWPPEDEPAPAEPTAADRADLEVWLDQVDDVGPPVDQVEDGMAIPGPATADDRRRFQSDVAEFYATHLGA